jgi:hypothetical protein
MPGLHLTPAARTAAWVLERALDVLLRWSGETAPCREPAPGEAPPDDSYRESRATGLSASSMDTDVAPEAYVDLQTVADRLGYSTRWVREQVKHHGLPTHQRGAATQHRLLWSEVVAWCSTGRGRNP